MSTRALAAARPEDQHDTGQPPPASTLDAPTVHGRNRAAGPIRLGIKNEVHEFAGGSARVFTLGLAGR